MSICNYILYCVFIGEQLEAGDVLSDIGNMLADLTDELDAILQQEMDSLSKR